METFLRCYTTDKPKTWYKYLAWAELSYNTSHHSSIKMTPFQALYGREPPVLMKFENGSTANTDLEQRLIERDTMLEVIKQHLFRAQQMMKQQADGHRRDVEFQVGDLVFVKLKPYRQQSLARRANEKLAARFYGPFTVEEKVGAVAYKLQLPETARIHPTFHVSQLKAAKGSPVEAVTLPAQLTEEGILVAEPEFIMGERHNQLSGQAEVLIKWKDLPMHDSTWEWRQVIQGQFPWFDLEDKVNFTAGGIDRSGMRSPIIYHYQRRGKRTNKEEAVKSKEEEQ